MSERVKGYSPPMTREEELAEEAKLSKLELLKKRIQQLADAIAYLKPGGPYV